MLASTALCPADVHRGSGFTHLRSPSAHPLVVLFTAVPAPFPAPETPLPTAEKAPPTIFPAPDFTPCTVLLSQPLLEDIDAVI
jgi:hypothetical protein